MYDLQKIYKGKILIHKKHFAFIENQPIFFNPANINDAFDKDIVEYKIIEDLDPKYNTYKAEVIKILERNKATFVCEIIENFPHVIGKLDDYKINEEIRVFNYPEAKKAEKIIVKISNFNRASLECEYIKSLGDKSCLDVEISSIMHESSLPIEFSEETNKLIKNLENNDIKFKIEKSRKDLTHLPFVTIDPKLSIDADDAIFVEKTKEKNYKLYVAISDIWNYIEDLKPVYDDALLRTSSLYIFDKVIPMIPHYLSSNQCSILENKKRAILIIEMLFNNYGNIMQEKTKIYPAIIKSQKKFNYDEVNDNWDNLDPLLINAKELYEKILKNKEKIGLLDLSTKKYKYDLNEFNEIHKISDYIVGKSEQMIEFFMILANTSVANIYNQKNINCIYRHHDKPSDEKINNFIADCQELGINIEVNDFKNINTKFIYQLLQEVPITLKYHFKLLVLQHLFSKAIYTTKNKNHFGLNERFYLHFTSPIRRLADLINHQIFYMQIWSRDNYSEIEREEFNRSLEKIAEYITSIEIKQNYIENSIIRNKLLAYIKKNSKNNIFKGLVLTRNPKSYLIKINNLYETFVFSKKKLRLNTIVKIKLLNTDEFIVIGD